MAKRSHDAVPDSDDGEVGAAVHGCGKRLRSTELLVRVRTPANDPVAFSQVRAVDVNSGAVIVLQSGVTAHVDPATYDIRAYADWHLPAPQTQANVVVAEYDRVEQDLILTPVEYNLHVDANRDGLVDNALANLDQWTWGVAGTGAVILCNNDDDDAMGELGHGFADNLDDLINHNNDPTEIAPLEVRRQGAIQPAGWTATLEILAGNEANARIFASRNVGAARIAGPGLARSQPINLNFQSAVYGIEAVNYPGAGFNGVVDVELVVEAPGMNANLDAPQGTVQSIRRVRFRVAPWIMPNHFDPALNVYVADLGNDNLAMRQALTPLAVNLVTLPQGTHQGDRWLQDCMEIGYSNLPLAGVNAVLISPRGRELRNYPPTLLAADVGFHNASAETNGTTYDSFGNLEVTPPIPNYPLGRIYYGHGTVDDPFDRDIRDFLADQLVQAPIQLDATWLVVGHVDEMMTIVPDLVTGGGAFKILLASPRLAYQLLDGIAVVDRPNVVLFRGRRFRRKALFWDPGRRDSYWETVVYDAEVRADAFLQDGLLAQEVAAFPGLTRVIASDAGQLDQYNRHNDYDLRTTDFDDGAALRNYNLNTCQPKLDAVRATLKHELNVTDADILDVPVLFTSAKMGRTMAGALSGDMVNMLVLGANCVIPRPFGPEQGGAGVQYDLFAQNLAATLQGLGLTPHFVDDWDAYHVKAGEVHCGTNVMRRPNAWPAWWTYQ